MSLLLLGMAGVMGFGSSVDWTGALVMTSGLTYSRDQALTMVGCGDLIIGICLLGLLWSKESLTEIDSTLIIECSQNQALRKR